MINKNAQINVEVFQDTLKMIREDKDLLEKQKISKENTKLYTNSVEIKEAGDKKFKISVVNARTFAAASKLSGKTAVLNFASGTCPGGGVKKGSPAQEECLCRISTLYDCLTKKELDTDYYKYHKELDSYLFSDRIIYSPDIVVIKSDTPKPEKLEAGERYSVDVISSAAPRLKEKDAAGNTVRIKVNENDILKCMKDRIRKIVSIAIENNNTNIVLGAFGCGAYFNNPNTVARAFKEILINEGYASHFENIVFAILVTKDKDKENLRIFDNIFKKYN